MALSTEMMRSRLAMTAAISSKPEAGLAMSPPARVVGPAFQRARNKDRLDLVEPAGLAEQGSPSLY